MPRAKSWLTKQPMPVKLKTLLHLLQNGYQSYSLKEQSAVCSL